MESEINAPNSQHDSAKLVRGPNDPQTPVEANDPASPSAQNNLLPDKSQDTPSEDIGHVTPTKPPAVLETGESLQHNKTLVDTVTDKMRGESMSLPPDSPAKNLKLNVPKSSNSNSGSDGDSSDKEQSRKRKLSSHSSIANETAIRQHPKRPKESDVPEREEDTEDPAPSTPAEAGTRKPVQVFGFGSFASVKSPFVSGQNTPSVVAPNATPNATSQPVSKADDSKLPIPNVPPPSVALANAQSSTSGFAAFSATPPSKRSSVTALPSPGVTPSSEQRESLAGPVRRSKSPVGKHQAFGQYSAGMSRFGNLSSRKSTQDETPNQQPAIAQSIAGNQTEFEDILKAKGEETVNHHADKLDIQEIEHNTGEEEDLTVFQTRAKLYTQDETFAYKERGTGLLKINVRRSDGEGARIVMRAEGVLRLLLNMPLYPGLICELGPDPKFIKVAEITTHERRLHAVKVGNAKVAQELYDHLMDNTPSKTSAFESS